MTLAALFAPRSIALVGATDKSGWSVNTLNNLLQFGFDGEIQLVNPRGGTVHGRQAHRSLAAIPTPVDLAYVMVPTGAVLDVLRDGAAAGIRSYVVLTAGFGETGAEGRALEDSVAAFASEHDLTVLGPNGNGYVNAAANVTPYGLPIPSPLRRGSVGVVLQSGALASAVLMFAHVRGIGLSLLTSMGNEAVVSVTDVIDHLVDDPQTTVIALFLESIRHTDEFVRVARRALAAGKPIVALKIGRSPLASHTAQAHTGALVGDDAVIDAAFGQLGVIRVRSVEDLMITAGLLATTGPLPGNRIGVVTPSGGASEIIADRAEDEGIALPAWAPVTAERLRELLPPYASVANPLDVTGYVVVDRTLLGNALALGTADPGVDAVLLLSDLPRLPPPNVELTMALFERTAGIIAASPVPVVVVSNTLNDVTEFGHSVQEQAGYPAVVGGIEHAMTALGHAVRWSEVHRRTAAAPPATALRPVTVPADAQGLWAEHRAATFLAGHGVPVVPSTLATDAEQAVAAAERLGWPVVLKTAAAGLGHKSDVGGVRLGLGSAVELRAAYTAMTAALDEPRVLVQPQRGEDGVELLVGVVRDPEWGLTLAVALGGIWVEILRDSALRLLPADRPLDAGEVHRMLGELRGARLLAGPRGTAAADVDRVAEVIVGIAELARGLGDRLESLEINPLRVHESDVEALDALITWR
ncbi:acetate--CoA ligase family protein [Pseudonocardia sp. GCM10023141]|uniref:acetate--CoA ligase family protein n=1 Tax=Pseudonocardia sp. GCM10023141 TaxID=3252653 RepID=UPI00361C898C